jgi:hypothetical protein
MVTIKSGVDGMSVITLTGSFDQGDLQGLLGWLYSFGLQVISVIYVQVLR